MYTIKATRYNNDYDKQATQMTFESLEAIYRYLKDISCDFNSKHGNFFPVRNMSFRSEKEKEGYNWCSRIECRDEGGHYWCFWIHQIRNEDGIVYSDGKYTRNEKYCSKHCEEWLNSCYEKMKDFKNEFVED